MDDVVGLLLVSFVITWAVGLTPPLLLRFIVLGRPLSRWPAIGLAAAFWVGNLLFFAALGSESRTHTALLLIAIASYAILTKGAAGQGSATSRPAAQPEPSPAAEAGGGATAPATRHDFGAFLAHEALTWATSGKPSPSEALKGWDLPRATSESRLAAETYLLHVAAFVEASLSFGVDGMEIQAALIQEASSVVAELSGDRPGAATLVGEALDDYVGSGPTDGSMSEVLRFGLIAISRIFGQPYKDPGAAFFLVQVFQSARANAADLIGNVLAHGLTEQGRH